MQASAPVRCSLSLEAPWTSLALAPYGAMGSPCAPRLILKVLQAFLEFALRVKTGAGGLLPGWILAATTWIIVWAVQRLLRQAQKRLGCIEYLRSAIALSAFCPFPPWANGGTD